MAKAEQPLFFSSKHLNRGLFSDYYLNDIVPSLPEWSDDNVLFARARDLRFMGWRVLVIWECQLRDVARVRRRVAQFMEDC